MSINGQTFFEGRKHVGHDGFVLYVHEEINSPRERKDFTTTEEMLDYLSEFNLSVTPEQVIHEMTGPAQKDTNPPGRKLIFTGRRKSEKIA